MQQEDGEGLSLEEAKESKSSLRGDMMFGADPGLRSWFATAAAVHRDEGQRTVGWGPSLLYLAQGGMPAQA